MFKTHPSDPGVVAFSLSCYRLLLYFFPARFRREYGHHMAQVFRDSCLRTYGRSGPPGMLALWAHTLFDWFKILIEEQSNRETEMSRQKLIRLSGWGLMLGPLALFIGLGDPAQYRSLLLELFGPPSGQAGLAVVRFASETAPLFLMLSGLGLILFGFWGLYTKYRGKTGRLGQFNLRMAALSSAVATFGGVLSLADLYLWWLIFIFGLMATFVFLTFFGVTALWEKPLSRWNALPLTSGGWFLGASVLGLALGWDENPYFLILPMLFALLGLSLLGYVLQSDAGEHSIPEFEIPEDL